MLFQEFNLFPHMTVLENLIEAPMRVRGMSRDEAVALADQYLVKVGLTDKRDEHPARLSGRPEATHRDRTGAVHGAAGAHVR